MPEPEHYEDEVNLRDYINIILKYKWLIIGIFLVATATTAIISLIMSKTYKSEATIEIAKVGGPIYSFPETKHLILSQKVLSPVIDEFLPQFKKRPTLKQFRKKIEVKSVKNTSFINLSLKHKDAKLTKKMLDSLIQSFFKFGQAKYKEKLTLLKQDLQPINKQLETTKHSLKELRGRIAALTQDKSKIPPDTMSKIILLENLISDAQQNYNKYLTKKLSLRQKIKTAKSFSIINSPYIPDQAIAPKKRQMTAISGIVSLMFAVFLTFFIEFMRTSEPSRTSRKGD